MTAPRFMERGFRLAIEGGWIALGQVTSVIGAILLVSILTDRLGPKEYGQLSLILTVAGLMNQLLYGGIVNGTSRFYSVASSLSQMADFVKATRNLIVIATCIAFVISLACIGYFAAFDFIAWVLPISIVSVYAIICGINSFIGSIQSAARQRAVVALHSSADSWLRIILIILMIGIFGPTSSAAIGGYAASVAIVTTSQFIFFNRTINPLSTNSSPPTKINVDKFKHDIWDYSRPFILWGIFGWAQQSAGRWMLEAYATTSDVGYFAVLQQIGYSPIATAASMALTFLTPIMFARVGDASSKATNARSQSFIILSAVLGSVLAIIVAIVQLLMHEFIFKIFVGTEYQSCSYLLPYMSLAAGLFSTAQFLAIIPMMHNLSSKLILASIGSSLIGIIACIVGARYYGLVGVVIATVTHAIAYLIFVILTIRKM